MLSSGTTCYHLGWNVIIWDAMLSSGANVIIWDKMLSSGMQCYHLELMLSSGMKCRIVLAGKRRKRLMLYLYQLNGIRIKRVHGGWTWVRPSIHPSVSPSVRPSVCTCLQIRYSAENRSRHCSIKMRKNDRQCDRNNNKSAYLCFEATQIFLGHRVQVDLVRVLLVLGLGRGGRGKQSILRGLGVSWRCEESEVLLLLLVTLLCVLQRIKVST